MSGIDSYLTHIETHAKIYLVKKIECEVGHTGSVQWKETVDVFTVTVEVDVHASGKTKNMFCVSSFHRQS
jgi:hypothetical protein